MPRRVEKRHAKYQGKKGLREWDPLSLCWQVLSAGAWVRGISRFPIQLPHEIEESIGDIEEFYKQRHSGRKLHFHPLLSHGTLTFQSKLGKYELEVSAMQLSLLSCWNRRPNDELTIEELVLGTPLNPLRFSVFVMFVYSLNATGSGAAENARFLVTKSKDKNSTGTDGAWAAQR